MKPSVRPLGNAVAVLIDEGAATYWELEHQRTLYGATVPELVEILHGLPHQGRPRIRNRTPPRAGLFQI